MLNPKKFIRPNIAALEPYQSARSAYITNAIRLDANENPFGDGKSNRYPDPYQSALRQAVAQRMALREDQIVFGNGSDELIDLLIRVTCEPLQDRVLICPPTFGMYEFSATINNVAIEKIDLLADYQLNVAEIIKSSAQILFLPFPSSPTGNLFSIRDLEAILNQFQGLVVLDEAYIDFAAASSWSGRLAEFPRAIVLQTFSKYWGLAGCRIGMAFAGVEIIQALEKTKMPYNLNQFSAEKALEALQNEKTIRANAEALLGEREKLKTKLQALSFVAQVFSSQTNFLWVQSPAAKQIYLFLKEAGILVRWYGATPDFLRISVGSSAENQKLIDCLKNYQP